MIVPIAIGAAALWVYYRRSHGLPISPFGEVPHIIVLTPAGPAAIPASTKVVPVESVSPQVAMTLAQATAATQISDGIHAPRTRRSDPTPYNPGAAQGAAGMFDAYDTMPASLRTDSMGVLRSYSLASRPFESR